MTGPGERSFAFEFDRQMARLARLFGITPDSARAVLDGEDLVVRFGPWSLHTPVANIAEVQITGPYRWWRVAGPAHLSLADRGLTFATTARQGVCVAFKEPVPGIEPSGRLRHPGATFTVADVAGFVDALEQAGVAVRADGRIADAPDDDQHGTWLGAAFGVINWHRRSSSIHHTERAIDEVEPAPSLDSREPDKQTIDNGVGPRFHRCYSVAVRNASMDAESLMASIQRDPNVVAPAELGPFVRQDGAGGTMAVGDRYLVNTPGPWKACVEVTLTTLTSFRLATLDGHMEAGQIQFAARDDGDLLVFEIESWAKSADRAFDVFYDLLGVGKSLQSEMWTRTCEAVATVAGGEQAGPVDLLAERAEPDDR